MPTEYFAPADNILQIIFRFQILSRVAKPTWLPDAVWESYNFVSNFQ